MDIDYDFEDAIYADSAACVVCGCNLAMPGGICAGCRNPKPPTKEELVQEA